MDKIEFEYLRGLMETMIGKQDVRNLPPENPFQMSLSRDAENLYDQFEKDWNKYQDEKTTEKEREAIDKNLKSLAKALPGVTQGTISAIAAFRDDDAMRGSAAIMDICGSLASLVGSLSAAGGPPGMLIGAIFSMIGQILNALAPQSESLTSKIEKLLRESKAEEAQQNIKTVHQSIKVYTESLRTAAHNASAEMGKAEPLLSTIVTKNIINYMNPVEGNTVTQFRGVMNWLAEPNNQRLDLWPTILNAACQAWADMMAAALTLLSSVNSDQVQIWYDKVEISDDREARKVQKALTKLQADVMSLLIALDANNAELQKSLKDLVPVARNRGMFWMLGENRQTYAGTNIKQGEFAKLGGSDGKSISVTIPRKDIGEPRPTYYQIGMEVGDNGRTYIAQVKPPYKGQESRQLVDADGKDAPFRSLSDIWAEPGDKSNTIWVYTAKGKDIQGAEINVDKAMEKASMTNGYRQTLKANVKSVRVLRNPQAFLEDPDNTPGIMTGVDYCVYGGLARENSEIYVDIGSGKSGYVPSPWGGYDGLGVDQHYVWVFGSGGFACATHASIVRCLQEKKGKPRWMEHWPEKPKAGGLVDMCPCDDGTLVVSIRNELFTVVYQTDLKKETIDAKWTKIEVSTGVRVHKLPMFGWSLFESLPVALKELAPQLASRRKPPRR